MLVRGKGRTLEVVLTGPFSAALGEVREHLESRAGFYRGARATADLSGVEPAAAEIRETAALFEAFGVALDGVFGTTATGEAAEAAGVAYLGLAPLAEVTPVVHRSHHPVMLSDRARSLTADFAGARADLAARRTVRSNGIAAARNVKLPHGGAVAPIGISTLYHRGTLRGGQSLHNLGNIVLIGDLNPGAELVASGDIVVFGALRGVAHAGAQGDRAAVVMALDLAPTQLRIATLIATDGGDRGRRAIPECARIDGERIAIVPHGEAGAQVREIVR